MGAECIRRRAVRKGLEGQGRGGVVIVTTMSRNPALPPALLRALRSVGRRRRALAVLQSAAWMALGFTGLVLALPALALVAERVATSRSMAAGPGPWGPALLAARLLWLAAAAGTIVLPLQRFSWEPFRRSASLLRIARAVDERVPETRSGLLVAVDLQRFLDDEATALHDAETRRLAQLHLDRADAAAAHVSASALLPLPALGRRTLVGPLLLAVAALLATQWPGRFAAGWAALRAGAEDPQSLDAGAGEAATLTLRNVRIVLDAPDYSRRADLILDGSSGDFQALPGTRVFLDADLPVSGTAAAVLWQDAPPQSATLEKSRIHAQFQVPATGGYRIELQRSLGREPLRTRRFRVDALPDLLPELEVAGPPDERLELKPQEEVSLAVRASDDFGLSRMDLVIERLGREMQRIRVDALPNGASRWEDVVRWAASSVHDGQGGDLALVVEVWDNDTVSGPKKTRSRPVELYVPTPRDHHARVLDHKTRLLNQALDLLAALLVADQHAREQTATSRVIADHESHGRMAQALFETARDLAQSMSQDRWEREDVFLGIGRAVENLARRWSALDEFVEVRVRPLETATLPGATVAALVEARESAVSELERISLDLAAFVDIHSGEDARASLADLEPGMADLADLLRRGSEGEPVSKQLEDALAELQQRLQEIAQQLAERRNGPDDSFTNRLPKDLGPDVMQQIRELAQQGRWEEARALLEKAMQELDRLQEGLDEEVAGNAGSQESSALDAQLQAALDRVKELEKEQQRVNEQTADLERRFGSGDGMTAAQRADVSRRMEELRQRIRELPLTALDDRLRGSARQWANLAGRVAQRMQDAALDGRLDEAAGAAATAEGYLQELSSELQAQRQNPDAARQQAIQSAGTAAELAGQIAERLRNAQSAAEQSRQRSSQAGAQAQSGQSQVREGTAELREQVEGIGGSAWNPVRGREALEQAGKLMERAGDRIAEGRAGAARANGQDALKQLQAFRNELEDARQSMQAGGRMGQGQAGAPGMAAGPDGGQRRSSQRGSDPWGRAEGALGQFERGEVVMPEPEDFVSPEAFRALVQEGATQDAPERYRPLNRNYYEELIK
jgi:hypothetical protein